MVAQIHLEMVAAFSSFPALLSLIGMNKQRLPLGAPNSDFPLGSAGIYQGSLVWLGF